MALFGTEVSIEQVEDGLRYTWGSPKWQASVRFRVLPNEQYYGFSLFVDKPETDCDVSLLRALMKFASGRPQWVHHGPAYWYKPDFLPPRFDLVVYSRRAKFAPPDGGSLDTALFNEMARQAERRWTILNREERKETLRKIGADYRKWQRSIECAAGYKPSIYYKLVRRLTGYYCWPDLAS